MSQSLLIFLKDITSLENGTLLENNPEYLNLELPALHITQAQGSYSLKFVTPLINSQCSLAFI